MKIRYLALLSIALLPLTTHSNELSYNYIQAAYTTTDIDVSGINIDGNGISIGVSKAINNNIAVVALYSDDSYDYDLDTNELQFGIMYHTPANDKTDIIFGFKIINAEISHPILGSEDDTGNILNAGIRTLLNPDVEFSFELSRVDVFDDTSTGFRMVLGIDLNDKLQAGIGYGHSDDSDSISFGIRANF